MINVGELRIGNMMDFKGVGIVTLEAIEKNGTRWYSKNGKIEFTATNELKEALEYCQNKLYILVNTPNGVKDNIKIDAQKAYDKCNEVLNSKIGKDGK